MMHESKGLHIGKAPSLHLGTFVCAQQAELPTVCVTYVISKSHTQTVIITLTIT